MCRSSSCRQVSPRYEGQSPSFYWGQLSRSLTMKLEIWDRFWCVEPIIKFSFPSLRIFGDIGHAMGGGWPLTNAGDTLPSLDQWESRVWWLVTRSHSFILVTASHISVNFDSESSEYLRNGSHFETGFQVSRYIFVKFTKENPHKDTFPSGRHTKTLLKIIFHYSPLIPALSLD